MKKSIILILSLIFVCCENFDNREQKKNFVQYMSDQHDIVCSEVSDRYYYLMPMQGCDDCIVNSIKYLMSIEDSKLRDKITLIFVGELRKNHYRISSQDVQKLKEIYKFVDDKMQDIFKYQTGFAYPLFVHLKNGKIKSYKEMTYDKFPTVFDKIRKSN